MADSDMAELRKEVIEARNQAIKTDNQMKNLALDVRGFDKRFDTLERRTRIAGIGANVIVALTIAVAAYVVMAVRGKSHENDLKEVRAEATQAEDTAKKQQEKLDAELARIKKQEADRATFITVSQKLLTLLERGKDKDAADLLPQLNMKYASKVERQLMREQVEDLRQRASEAAYKSAKSALSAKKEEAAVKDFKRALDLDPKGRYASQSRYLYAITLFQMDKFKEAEPALRDLRSKEPDKNVQDEARYYLAKTLVQLGKKSEAKPLLTQASSQGRFQVAAKRMLTALDKPATSETESTETN